MSSADCVPATCLLDAALSAASHQASMHARMMFGCNLLCVLRLNQAAVFPVSAVEWADCATPLR